MADAPKIVITGVNKDSLRTGAEKINKAIDNANEALGTANTAKSTADTAKSTADSALANSESTQAQLDAVVVDGDSSPAIAQALADTPYTTLRQKHDAVDAQLAETEKKQSHFSRYQLEKAGEPHQDNFAYTSFFSGVVFNGKEIHVGRAGTGHTGNSTILVAYIREDDGKFTRKKIGGNINYSIGDYRDPNLFINPVSKKLYLSVSVKKLDGTYTNYFCELNTSYDVAVAYEMSGMGGYFTWGNSIPSSDGFTLRLGYDVVTANKGVALFKSGTISGSTIPFNKIADIFPPSISLPTECTLAQWGDRLIAIARQDNGNMVYRQTYDLTGATGWGEITDLGFKGDAPVLLPYTPADKPLIIGRSIGGGTYQRSPVFNVTFDLKNYTSSLFVDQLQTYGGGYHSLVPNRNGFGIMYYQDGSDPAQATATSNVFYKEMDIEQLLSVEIEYLKNNKNTLNMPINVFRNNEAVAGDATLIDAMFSSSANVTEMEFEVKKNISVKAVELLLNNNGTLSTTLEIREDGVLIGTSNAVSVSTLTKTAYSFPFATAISLQMGKRYNLKLTAAVRNHSKNFINPFNKIDFGDFVYLKTKHNGTTFDKNIIPFGLVKNI
ncbi:glycoside hydrolase [Mesobacillus subterraneus]|uniref:glycoside hydrolase n=1 Tax=Mesobacillus subterraneus TaxID=285983 RepID=UPI002041E2A5|nr:glycoside hydrolase [Mesobacillus subterraneus]MCM3665505.1 glycoside hydrolase [Mesobacillus subterraneus]MCM3686064.1 glycoside hydrolase [Mesobacillus subterraneus]